MEYSWIPIQKQARSDWEKLCPTGTYKVVKPAELPAEIAPIGLKKKSDSILVISSGTKNGTAYCMLNYQRVDGTEIDQEPFMFGFIGDDSTSSGCLVHHGNWTNRTTSVPPGFEENLVLSGIGTCFPLIELPDQIEGPLEDLKKESHREAFQVILKKFIGGKK